MNNAEKRGVKDVYNFRLPPRHKLDLAVLTGLGSVGDVTEMSVTKYQSALHHIPEKRRSKYNLSSSWRC